MVASQIRQEARNNLTGKWGKAALICLTYSLLIFLLNLILRFIPVIGSIAVSIISLPLSFGFISSYMKLKRGENVSYTEFLNTGFANFGKTWAITGNIILKMLLLIVLLIVFIIIIAVGSASSAYLLTSHYSSASAGMSAAGIIGIIGYLVCLIALIPKSYLYALSFYVFYDNPNMSAKEIVEKSEQLMRGNRWRFFWLQLTFIGWAILSVFTIYIGLLWLIPYIMISTIIFYEELIGNKQTIEVTNNDNNNPISE